MALEVCGVRVSEDGQNTLEGTMGAFGRKLEEMLFAAVGHRSADNDVYEY